MQGAARQGELRLGRARHDPALRDRAVQAAGQLDALHVPYKGSGPLLTDLIGGQIQFSFETMTAATPHLKNGRVVALAQTRAKRSKAYPDVPTMQEQGYAAFETMNWYGISGPAKLPAALVRRSTRTSTRCLRCPTWKQLDTFGVEDGGGTRGDAEFVRSRDREVGQGRQGSQGHDRRLIPALHPVRPRSLPGQTLTTMETA